MKPDDSISPSNLTIIGATLAVALWEMQGRKRQSVLVENTTTKLDLGGLPAGLYLVSLAQNGRVVERRKLIKH